MWYLCQWVSIYQFILSFAFVPLLPYIGASKPLSELPYQFYKGLLCFAGEDGCGGKGTMWLLLGYTALNFLFNAIGLMLTKHGSAVLRAISYALILPLTSLSFALPFMGQFREVISPWTIGGLFVALLGFAIYQRYMFLVDDGATEGDRGDEDPLESGTAEGGGGALGGQASAAGAAAEPIPYRRLSGAGTGVINKRSHQSTFQERVIGMGMAHRPRRGTWAGGSGSGGSGSGGGGSGGGAGGNDAELFDATSLGGSLGSGGVGAGGGRRGGAAGGERGGRGGSGYAPISSPGGSAPHS